MKLDRSFVRNNRHLPLTCLLTDSRYLLYLLENIMNFLKRFMKYLRPKEFREILLTLLFAAVEGESYRLTRQPALNRFE